MSIMKDFRGDCKKKIFGGGSDKINLAHSETVLVGAFSGHCETSQRFVDSSS